MNVNEERAELVVSVLKSVEQTLRKTGQDLREHVAQVAKTAAGVEYAAEVVRLLADQIMLSAKEASKS